MGPAVSDTLLSQSTFTNASSTFFKWLMSPKRVLLDLLDLQDHLELLVVDLTLSASLSKRRPLIPSVVATTALTTPT